jgi:predicted DNA-binding transcriptional regulator YafY
MIQQGMQFEPVLSPEITQPQRERLFHIDFRGFFLGQVTRADLMLRFDISGAAATRDIALYRRLAPGNIELDPSTKAYLVNPGFRPLFVHDPARALVAVADGLGDATVGPGVPHLRAEHPLRLNPPRVEVLATLTRAIAQGRALTIAYHSLTSGETQREIVPHALVDTGVRWHVRAYDRRRSRFADFVLTRISATALLPGAIRFGEDRESDDQWMRHVTLELVPHPGLSRPEPVMRDYAMTGGVMRIRMRAAVCGYALVHWSVDISPDHRLDPARHHLWLRNRAAVHGVENLEIAPGFSDPDRE